MAWKCPECGRLIVKDSYVKCRCGYEHDGPIPQSMRVALCPVCLEHNFADQDFCSKCGLNLKLYRSDPHRNVPVHREPAIKVPSQELSLEFNGSAREYFRVWIVNLCLSLLTAGIFSAWAKVRRKRYFYSHTLIDGTPFQYLGQPVPILKGRLMAAAAFSLYYLSMHFLPSLLPYVLVTGLALAPWVIVRSAAFNARYSAYRNMTFHFAGRYRDALKVIFSWGLIPALVIGTCFRWWGNYKGALILFALFGLAFPWWMRRLKKLIVSYTSYGQKKAELSATGGQFFKVYFTAGCIMVGAAFIAGLLKMTLYNFAERPHFPFLTALPIYIGYVCALACVRGDISNVVWNETSLGSLHFRSTLDSCELAKIYLTNIVAIVCSLGLLTPWAVMRTLKYRAENMGVFLVGEFTEFQGSHTDMVRAAGAELGDFFNVDLSL